MEPQTKDAAGEVEQGGDHKMGIPPSDSTSSTTHINPTPDPPQENVVVTQEVPFPLSVAPPTHPNTDSPPLEPPATPAGSSVVEMVGDASTSTTTTQPKDAFGAAVGGSSRYTIANAGDFVADNYFPGEEHTTTLGEQECAEGDLLCVVDITGEEGGQNGVHEAGDDAPTGDTELEDVVESSGIGEEDVEVEDTIVPSTTPPSSPPQQTTVDSNGKGPTTTGASGGGIMGDGVRVPANTEVHTNPTLEEKPAATITSSNVTTAPKKRARTGIRAEKELRGAGNWRYFLTKQATYKTSPVNVGSFSEWALDWLDVVISRTPASMLHSLCYYQPYQGNAYGAQTQPLVPPLHKVLGDVSSTPYALVWMWDWAANLMSHTWRRAQFRMCYHVPREVVCQVSSRAVLKPLLGSGQPAADLLDHTLLRTLLTSSHKDTTQSDHTTLWLQLADILPSNNLTNGCTLASSPVTSELTTRLLETFHNSVDIGCTRKRGPFHKFVSFDLLPFVDSNALFQMAVGAVLASTNVTLRNNASHIEDVASTVRYLLRGNPMSSDSGVGTLHGLTSGATPLGGVFRLIDTLTSPTMEGYAGVDSDVSHTNFSIFGSQPNISRLCATTKLFANGTFLYASTPPGPQGSIDMEELLRPIFLLSYAAGHTALRMVLEGVAWVVGGMLWAVIWAPFGLVSTLHYLLLRYNYNCAPFRAPIFVEAVQSDMDTTAGVAGGDASMAHNSSVFSDVSSVGLAAGGGGVLVGLEAAWVDYLQPFIRPLWEGMGLGVLEVWTCNWELVHEGSTDHSVQEALEGYPVTLALCIVAVVLVFTCCAVYLRYQKYFDAIITLRERGMSRLEEIAAYEREQQKLSEECDLPAHNDNLYHNEDVGNREVVSNVPGGGDQTPPAAQALSNVSFPRRSTSISPSPKHISPIAIRRVTLQSNGIPCPTPKRSSARITTTDSQPQLHPTAAIVNTPPPSQDRPDEMELFT